MNKAYEPVLQNNCIRNLYGVKFFNLFKEVLTLKKLITLSTATILAFGITACGAKEQPAPPATPAPVAAVTPAPEPVATPESPNVQPAQPVSVQYNDGTYTAAMPTFDQGWKSTIEITVSGGKITAVNWNGENEQGGKDKKTTAKDGEYNMVENGNAQAEWDVQAKAMEDELIRLQDPTLLQVNAEGYTDAVSGVSIHVNEFQALAIEALQKAIGTSETFVQAKYKDGTYNAKLPEFDKGWKSTIEIVVADGSITAVTWSGENEKGGKDKKTTSIDGEYNMVAQGNSQSEWHVQAKAMEDELIKLQDPTLLNINAEGYTDAVSGVSIHVNEFQELAIEALKAAQ